MITIKVKPWKGRDEQYYHIVIQSGNGTLEDDWLTQQDVDSIATRFLDDTVFHDTYSHEIIQRLIDVNIIDIELMKEYLTDLEG